jgi:competence protein ComEC
MALALFVIALVLLPLAGRIARARAAPLTVLAAAHASAEVELTVTADPQPLAATGTSGAARVAVATSPDRVLWHGQWLATEASGSVLVLADASGWRDVLPGQRVQLAGGLEPPLGGGSLSVTLFARAPPRLLGRPPWYQRLAGRVRTGLRTAAAGLPNDERGLLPGLVDGDTTELDPALAENFRLAGLTHLVAVSGTNCSLVVGAALLVLRRMRLRPWLCALLGGIVLAMFVVVARPSPSVCGLR